MGWSGQRAFPTPSFLHSLLLSHPVYCPGRTSRAVWRTKERRTKTAMVPFCPLPANITYHLSRLSLSQTHTHSTTWPKKKWTAAIAKKKWMRLNALGCNALPAASTIQTTKCEYNRTQCIGLFRQVAISDYGSPRSLYSYSYLPFCPFFHASNYFFKGAQRRKESWLVHQHLIEK